MTDLLYRKRTGIPLISLSIAYSCVLVSLIVYFKPEYYDILGGSDPVFYPWQYLTNYLQHGTTLVLKGLMHPFLQLALNLLVILIFGSLAERVLGTKRFLAFIGSSLALALVVRLIFGIREDGIAPIAWSFAPAVCLILLYSVRKLKRRILSDPVLYICLALLAAVWLVVTVANLAKGLHTNNLLNLTGTVAGASLAYLWKGYITRRVTELLDGCLEGSKRDILDRSLSLAGLVIPCLIIAIQASAISGSLKDHVTTSYIVEICPRSGSIEDINNADKRIILKFSEPMREEIAQSRISIESQADSSPLSGNIIWADDKTLVIRFNRAIQNGEQVDVMLKGLRDTENRGYYDIISLVYN